jgi:hypothetical protein
MCIKIKKKKIKCYRLLMFGLFLGTFYCFSLLHPVSSIKCQHFEQKRQFNFGFLRK